MTRLTLFLFLMFLLTACHDKTADLINVKEVTPWCIIGFDSEDRTPEQRIAMLKEMGFSSYGYNKGKGDLTRMKEEFQLAEQNSIQIPSVFLWLNAKRDSIGKLSPANQELLTNISEVKQRPTIWLSMSDNFFNDLTDEQCLELATGFVKYVKTVVDEFGCDLALYNHHGWFGNPINQVLVLNAISDESISIVYNFHHAQDYVDQFPEIVAAILPHLSFVNLNGVRKEGPQILPIGKGDHEFDMMKLLIDKGYDGPWGVLGHIKTEDVQQVLQRNMDGLAQFNVKYSK